MSKRQIVGSISSLILALLGVFFLVRGARGQEQFGAKVKHTFTGSYPTEVRNNMIAGIGLVVIGSIGAVYFLFSRKKEF